MLTIITFITLFSNALVTDKKKSIFYSRNILLSLLLVTYISYNNLYVISINKGVGLYSGTFNVSCLTQTFNIFIFIISAIILLHNSFYYTFEHNSNESNKHNNVKFNSLFTPIKNFINNKFSQTNLIPETLLNNINISKQYTIVEYPLILLFINLGSVFVMSSGDLISLFISIELQSYALYIICTLYRDSEASISGGLIYYLLGGLSSCFILLGSAIIYINTGTTLLDGIFIINSITEILSNTSVSHGVDNILPNITHNSSYINISLILIAVGFLFKISAAPFHFWSPNVYDAIPTIVTTTVAIIAKLSIFVILLDFIYFMYDDYNIYSWKNTILISSLFSLILGSLLGLTEKKIKRVYAYSTISHIGFILLALSIDSIESIQAYIFYVLTYSLSNLNAFFILITIGYTMIRYYINNNNNITNKIINTNINDTINNDLITNTVINNNVKLNKEFNLDNDRFVKNNFINKKEIDNIKEIYNSPIQLVSQLKGYFYVNPYLTLSLSITLFSFMGIPPLVGFFAKQMVLSSALDKGYVFMVFIAILTSVMSAAYYLNIIKYMFFFESDYLNKNNNTLDKDLINKNKVNFIINNNNDKQVLIASPLSVIISILTLAILLFIFIPNESFNIAKILSLLIFK